MDINRERMDWLYRSTNYKFKKLFSINPDKRYERFVMPITAKSSKVRFPFIDQVAGMREWVSQRQSHNYRTDFIDFTNRHFELTWSYPLDELEDNEWDLRLATFPEFVKQAKELPNDLITELLNNAETKTWIDDKPFFCNNRVYKGEKKSYTINNLTDAELSEASLKAAYDEMKSWRGHEGRSLKVTPTYGNAILVHGPNLHWTVDQLLEQPNTIQEGVLAPNKMYHLVGHEEYADITGNRWFIMYVGGGYKPLLYWDRKSPDHLVRRDQNDCESVFKEGKVEYGLDARAEAALAIPHLIYMGNPA